MEPQNVTPNNFKTESILYNQDGFSIAYGEWQEDGTKHLAFRWNGKADELGFPQSFGNPTWFLIPSDLTIPFAKSLLDTTVDKSAIILLLQKIL
jgi:hypothetical protein